jgi:Putative metal-binding motif
MTARTINFVLSSLLLPALACRSVDADGFDLDGGGRDGRSDGSAGSIDPVRADGSAAGDGSSPDAAVAPADAAVPVDAPSPPADAKPPVPAPDAPAADAPPVILPPDAPPACTPVAEICDRKDNNCNGQVDEGFGTVNIGTTYQALATFHAGCNDITRFGPACNAAMHRFCVARGCHNTGFGPLENSGGNATVACVTGATLRTVSIATLTTYHPGCLAATHHSPACNAAINRYCAAQGFVTGYGPAEFDGSNAAVACLGPERTTVVNTSYTVLTGHHPACTAARERFGPACNAAINRFCASTGARTGFGPLENNADVAVVACLKP